MLNLIETYKKNHKYSVLISVYKNDNPEHLKEALCSVYEEQTVKPDEVVVIFDGPLTNELYKVLDEYRKGKEDIVRYFPQDTNKGLGEALRIGTEKCTGDYIFRMDADDISMPNRFEKQIQYIEEHPEIDCIGTYISEFYYSLNEEMRVRVVPKRHDEIKRMCKHRNPMNHVSVAIKKTALMRCGGYEELNLLEDYYLWIKMISSNCILANMPESLVYVRVGNDFISKRGNKNRIIGWKTLQRYMLKNNLVNIVDVAVNMMYIIGFTYCPNIIREILYKKFLRK